LTERFYAVDFFRPKLPFIKAAAFFNSPGGNQPQKMKRSGSFIEKPLSTRAISTLKRYLEHAPNENASVWQQSLGGAAVSVLRSSGHFVFLLQQMSKL
jgi:hypothetical protein